MTALALARAVLDRAVAAAAGRHADVVLKTDGGGWILDQFCGQIQKHLSGRLSVYVSPVPVAGLRRSVVHFIGSECFYDPKWTEHPTNAAIGTWWHGSASSAEASIRDAASRVAAVSGRLACVHVTCETSRAIVRGLGVAEHKIALVPMGVDVSMFAPPTPAERADVRRQLGIPADALVVGSFQKDGVGWGSGDEPKMLKGPDILIEVLRRVSARVPVLALVPGPARGFVKRSLGAAGIPFRARDFAPIEEFARYYHACDAYVTTGREEGGPASVLESLASGTPLVAHRTGMAPDVITDGVNGYVVDVGDVETMSRQVVRLLTDAALRARIGAAGVETAARYAWPEVALQYDQLYRRVRS